PRRSTKSRSNKPTRTISGCLRARGTSLRGMCAVTSATVIFPPVKHIAKFFTAQRSAKNSVWPGNLKPASYIRALWIGPVTTACSSPRRARVTASSSAAAAARAVSIDGSPGLQSGCRPISAYSSESVICFDFRARVSQRFGFAAVFVVDFNNVIVPAEVDNVADFSRLKAERGFFERRGQRLAVDPAPVTAFFASAVFGIKLGHALKLRAIDELAENFIGHRFLRGGISIAGVTRDHDQAQFDLRFVSEFVRMRFVIFVHFRRRGDR